MYVPPTSWLFVDYFFILFILFILYIYLYLLIIDILPLLTYVARYKKSSRMSQRCHKPVIFIILSGKLLTPKFNMTNQYNGLNSSPYRQFATNILLITCFWIDITGLFKNQVFVRVTLWIRALNPCSVLWLYLFNMLI